MLTFIAAAAAGLICGVLSGFGIGGGSLLLRPFLEASPLVAKADFVESPNANALGYEMLGRVQLSHRPA